MRRWAAAILWALAASAQAPDDMPGRTAAQQAAACGPCHRDEAPARWSEHRDHACSAYCQTCHLSADMARHHAVGIALEKVPKAHLPLASGRRTACFTCHTLTRPRYDQVRWKAESLFGRLFRRDERQKTYLLVTRNDRGQLCHACH